MKSATTCGMMSELALEEGFWCCHMGHIEPFHLASEDRFPGHVVRSVEGIHDVSLISTIHTPLINHVHVSFFPIRPKQRNLRT